MKRILIAGIGNIFHGDDAFGVEVLRHLQGAALPEGVRAIDFGIRSYDLAYAIADGYDATIFVDATAREGKPGTLYLMELDADNLEGADNVVNGHSLNPIAVLQMARSSGAKIGRLYLVGCEPAALECEDGRMELSAEVAAAVAPAIEMIRSLLSQLNNVNNQSNENPGLAGAATKEGDHYAIPA